MVFLNSYSTDMKKRTIAIFAGAIAACFFCVTGILAEPLSSEEREGLKALGLDYQFREITDPRLNRVHVLKIDLALGKVRLATVIADDPDGDGPAEAALTSPLKLASGQSVLAFVNTNPWSGFDDGSKKNDHGWIEGQPVDIHGFAVSNGRIRSRPRFNRSTVWVDRQGRLFMGNAPREGTALEGVAGFKQIVRNGALVLSSGKERHPRTAIGMDQKGGMMWLVVVDGRQEGYSEGMDLNELGRLMLDLGCWNAVNMDGGGSSIMGLVQEDGELHVVNSPSDRLLGIVHKIRPLPVVLTVQKK